MREIVLSLSNSNRNLIKGSKMRPIRILLLATMTLFVLSGCCWTDHSATIKEVAEPMLVELKTFYEKNKRFPTTQERDAMLEKVGCRVKGDRCMYHGKTIQLDVWRTNYDYKIRITLENTHGNFNLYKENGKVSDIRIYQKPCISLKQ